jgi:hypothetical protein
MDEATDKRLVASGEGIDCYRIGPWEFVAEDTQTGEHYEARSMYAAIGKALKARDFASYMRSITSMYGANGN